MYSPRIIWRINLKIEPNIFNDRELFVLAVWWVTKQVRHPAAVRDCIMSEILTTAGMKLIITCWNCGLKSRGVENPTPSPLKKRGMLRRSSSFQPEICYHNPSVSCCLFFPPLSTDTKQNSLPQVLLSGKIMNFALFSGCRWYTNSHIWLSAWRTWLNLFTHDGKQIFHPLISNIHMLQAFE